MHIPAKRKYNNNYPTNSHARNSSKIITTIAIVQVLLKDGTLYTSLSSRSRSIAIGNKIIMVRTIIVSVIPILNYDVLQNSLRQSY